MGSGIMGIGHHRNHEYRASDRYLASYRQIIRDTWRLTLISGQSSHFITFYTFTESNFATNTILLIFSLFFFDRTLKSDYFNQSSYQNNSHVNIANEGQSFGLPQSQRSLLYLCKTPSGDIKIWWVDIFHGWRLLWPGRIPLGGMGWEVEPRDVVSTFRKKSIKHHILDNWQVKSTMF